jgi:hypothetical protein
MVAKNKKIAISNKQATRFNKAKASFLKIKEDLAPYSKKNHPTRSISSISDWKNTSDIISGLVKQE